MNNHLSTLMTFAFVDLVQPDLGDSTPIFLTENTVLDSSGVAEDETVRDAEDFSDIDSDDELNNNICSKHKHKR